jgi:atypical dual specificity phosphatase
MAALYFRHLVIHHSLLAAFWTPCFKHQHQYRRIVNKLFLPLSNKLTKIGDAYRWFHGRIAEKPTNFSWLIEGKLAGCGLPVTQEEFEWLGENGIKSVVTVREVPLPSEWFIESDINYLHLEVEDFGAPSIEELDKAVGFIDDEINKNRPVMVHCAAGKGRTGAVLAAYLVKSQSLTAKDAIEKVRGTRPGSIQSVVQETAISMYEKYLRSKK